MMKVKIKMMPSKMIKILELNILRVNMYILKKLKSLMIKVNRKKMLL